MSSKKIDLSDFDISVTLGTGICKLERPTIRMRKTKKLTPLRFVWTSKTGEVQKDRRLHSVENSEKSGHHQAQAGRPRHLREHNFDRHRPSFSGKTIRLIPQVGLKGFTQDDWYLYFQLEYINGGELFTYLRTEGRLTPEHSK